MQSATLLNNSTVAHPFTAAKPSQRRSRHVQVVSASKDEHSNQAPSDMLRKTIGVAAAASVAFLPLSGAALARDAAGGPGKLAIEGGVETGQALQNRVPEGAKNPKVREDRNDSRDAGLASKLNTVKDRVSADSMMASADVEKGGTQNIFSPLFGGNTYPESGNGVAFDTPAAPSLQVNVSEKLNQKAGNAAQDAGQTVKKAAEKVSTAAPVYAPSSLQVNVGTAEKLQDKASQAAKETANTVKRNADPRNADPAIAGKALKSAGDNAIPKEFKTSFSNGNSLQINVGTAEKLQNKASQAAKETANTVKRNADPRNADPAIAGKALKSAGDNAIPKEFKTSFSNGNGLQINVGTAEKLQDKASQAAKETANTVKRNADPRNADPAIAGKALKSAGDNAIPKEFKTSFMNGNSLQTNVNEKLLGKAADAAKDAANTVKRNADPRNADPSIAGQALKDAGKNANPKNVAFSTSQNSLQVNVGNPVEKLQDKAAAAAKETANTVKRNANPANADPKIAGQALQEAGRNANPNKAVGWTSNGSSLQVNVGNPVDKAKGAIDRAAVTDASPQRQLEKAGQKAEQAKNAVQQRLTAFTPAAQGSLLHYVGSMDNASFQGPESNEGGITQGQLGSRSKESLPGNPKLGGDLKDSSTDFAAANKSTGERETDTGAFSGSAARNPSGKKGLFPGAAGGRGFLRDDSETPEATAAGNIAKAQQNNDSPLDGIKNAFESFKN